MSFSGLILQFVVENLQSLQDSKSIRVLEEALPHFRSGFSDLLTGAEILWRHFEKQFSEKQARRLKNEVVTSLIQVLDEEIVSQPKTSKSSEYIQALKLVREVLQHQLPHSAAQPQPSSSTTTRTTRSKRVS